MFRTARRRLGYRKKREYLDDGYANRSGIVVWLQRFIMMVLVIVLMVFLLLLGDVVHAGENCQQLPQVNLQVVNKPQMSRLNLITCYPFESIVPGGSQRYIVSAVEVNPQANSARSELFMGNQDRNPI